MRGYFTPQTLLTALITAILIACLLGLATLSLFALRDIDRLATARSDNVEWVLSQAEVELQKLQYTTFEELQKREPDLDRIRLRFDIFYSRAAPIFSAPSYAPILTYKQGREDADALLSYMESTIEIIDAPDDVLEANLDVLLNTTQTALEDMHRVSLEGVRVFSQRSLDLRREVTGSIVRLAILTLALIFLLVLGILALVYMIRLTRSEANQKETAFRRLDAVVSTALDAIVVIDTGGKVLEFNPMAEKIFGFQRSEIMGHPLANYIYPSRFKRGDSDKRQSVRELDVKALVGKGRVIGSGMRKDGSEMPLEVSVTEASYNGDSVYIGTLRDITQDLANEQELIQARDQAIAGEKARANMLAVMSHEIRTPLNGIMGSMELLEQTQLDDSQKELLSVMERSGAVLKRHVDDVLEISRIDSGSYYFANEKYSPVELVNHIIRELKTSNKNNATQIIAKTNLKKDFLLEGDPIRVQQALSNIIGNAMKFTRKGSVTININYNDQDETIVYQVVDTGAGIPRDKIDTIFDDFVTLDSSYMRSAEGTGLGLGIARRLVEAMNGSITVESELGVGSTFVITLPAKTQNRHASIVSVDAKASPVHEDALNILVVEDNKTNRFILRKFLEKENHAVYEAENGQMGIDMAGDQKFDIIFMDISMPEMDGLEATHRIKAGDGPNKETPILAVTAHALPDEVKQFRAAGMEDVVTKPITYEKIKKIVQKYQHASN